MIGDPLRAATIRMVSCLNDLAARLQRLEQFQHSMAYAQMLRIEQVQAQVAAPAAALGLLDFRIQQVQTELTGFRAEVHTELETIKAVQSTQGETLHAHGEMLHAHGQMLRSHGQMLQSHGELLQKILDRLPPR